MSFVYNGISIGIMLGIFSGALYLVGHTYHYASKLRRRGRQGAEEGAVGKVCCPCPCDGAPETPHTPSPKSALQAGRMRGPGARGLRCALCGTLVCRACSRVVRPSARIRLCGTCFQHRELSCPSGEWFYRELKTKFHDVTPSPSSSDSSLDVNMEVREFIERLTENLVSGSVDDVTVEPLSSHPEYEAICSQFHPRVQEILSRLSQSLQLAITDFPASKVAAGESPSEIHVQLKRLIVELRTCAMKLPLLEMDSCRPGDENEAVTSAALDFSRRTYEDLLATAIINKVVEGAQCVLMEQHLRSPTSHREHQHQCEHAGEEDDEAAATASTGTFISCMQIGIDDYESIPEEQKHKTMETVITVERATRRVSEDEGEEEDDEDSCSSRSSPEMTSPEEEETPEAPEAAPRARPRPKPRKNQQGVTTEMKKFLEGLKYSHRVPFPELGADIVEGSVQESLLEETARTTLYLVNSDSHHSSLSSASWEENWLFQRRRLRLAPSSPRKADEKRVPMLVPNPRAEDLHVRATVGDLDADQLSSDLSDYESYMRREEGWSEEDGDSLDSTGRRGGYAMARLLGADGPDLIEATNQELGATLILGPQVNGTESSEFDQQEGEYLEDFASVGQRSLTSLQEVSQASLVLESSQVPDILENTQKVTPEQLQEQKPQERSHGTPEGVEDDEASRLATPPRPGTIAEREHLKWQQARPIPNNPYSEENITRRLGRRQRGPAPEPPSGPTSLPAQGCTELTTPDTVAPHLPLKINCSGQTGDFKQYGRDYYINEIRSAKKMENNHDESVADSASPRSTVSATESAVSHSEPASLASLPSEERLDSALGSAVESGSTTAGSTAGSVKGSAASYEEEEPENVKMPSVRELAKQFGPPVQPVSQRKSGGQGKKSSRNSASAYGDERKIVIVEISTKPPAAPAPARQVHSLTARNLSKEFRAGLRGEGSPKPVLQNGTENVQNGTSPAPRPAERHRANLEFWRSLDPPTPAPRQIKK